MLKIDNYLIVRFNVEHNKLRNNFALIKKSMNKFKKKY